MVSHKYFSGHLQELCGLHNANTKLSSWRCVSIIPVLRSALPSKCSPVLSHDICVVIYAYGYLPMSFIHSLWAIHQ